jgi:hypothetical protein
VTVDTFFISKLKGLAKCICKPCWTTTAATPGDGSTPASCQSPQSMCSMKRHCRSSKLIKHRFIPPCQTAVVGSTGTLTIIPMSCYCTWRRLSTGQPRCADRRATGLSSGCIEPCSMNTSVSRGGQLGMSQWGRCRQTWTATLSTTIPSGHIRAG